MTQPVAEEPKPQTEADRIAELETTVEQLRSQAKTLQANLTQSQAALADASRLAENHGTGLDKERADHAATRDELAKAKSNHAKAVSQGAARAADLEAKLERLAVTFAKNDAANLKPKAGDTEEERALKIAALRLKEAEETHVAAEAVAKAAKTKKAREEAEKV